ncbi:MAG: histidine kinase [Verrucomicrobiales bacterium VVV1]|nr:MAG: histidine kinase [Verrucomicrobiales bacterium VVV1]
MSKLSPNSQTPTSERLRFSTAILRLLGEELNPSPDQGILELIKNSYDADAKNCTVELKGVHIKGGSIVLKDDGVGMTSEEIRNGWLIVGDSMKSRSETSPSGRLHVGSKGLGRLGALRLGRKVELTTRPKSEPGIQYRMEIDWASFDDAAVVEEVELAVTREEVPNGTSHGTEITVSELPTPWSKGDIKRLARAILLLRDPFAKNQGFQASLRAEEFVELEKLAHEGYFGECNFHLIAKVDLDGRALVEVRSSGGKRLFAGKHADVSVEKGNPIYELPPLTFELWEFKLSAEAFAASVNQTTVKAVKGWLEQFGGVRLYHRGVRVLPYGDPKNDWLDMNLRRSQHQELRPSTNNSIGCVRIEDPSGVFQQKTDRLGFVESHALDELRRFTDEALDWMSRERRKEREQRKKAAIERVQTEKNEAEKQMKSVIEKLPPTQRKEVAAAVKKMQTAHDAEVELKDETAQLYFTLGTVGTTAAAFAHQTKQPIRGIVADAKLLEEYLGDPQELALFREESSKAVKRIHGEARAIYSFSSVTLRLLEHEKRRSARHSVHELLNETVELLTPYFEARETTVQRDYTDGDLRVWCPRAAFEAIFTNLLTNSLQAFEARAKSGITSGPRLINLQTRVSGGMVTIRVQDNGPGIERLALEEIWLPGRTTTDKGTGLGLAIVKDVVEGLRGRVEAEAHGEFGGASFTITLPLKI